MQPLPRTPCNIISTERSRNSSWERSKTNALTREGQDNLVQHPQYTPWPRVCQTVCWLLSSSGYKKNEPSRSKPIFRTDEERSQHRGTPPCRLCYDGYHPEDSRGGAMRLLPADTERFYRIWFALLSYVNEQLHLVPRFPSTPDTANSENVWPLRPNIFGICTHTTHSYLLFGRGVWESNPPGPPLRRPPTVLKTATVTGLHTPPGPAREDGRIPLMQNMIWLVGMIPSKPLCVKGRFRLPVCHIRPSNAISRLDTHQSLPRSSLEPFLGIRTRSYAFPSRHYVTCFVYY